MMTNVSRIMCYNVQEFDELVTVQLSRFLPEIKCGIVHLGINNKFPSEKYTRYILPDDNIAEKLINKLYTLVERCPNAIFYVSLPIYRDYHMVTSLCQAITTEKRSADRNHRQLIGRVKIMDHDMEDSDWFVGGSSYNNAHPNPRGYRTLYQNMIETFRQK